MQKHRIERNLAFPTEEVRARVRACVLPPKKGAFARSEPSF